MLRRIGYGLGLLFVLACVAAIPLTWAREAGIRFLGSRVRIYVRAASGQAEVGAVWTPKPFPYEGFSAVPARRQSPEWQGLFRFSWRRVMPGLGAVVSFPLWMPAVAASLFMAWRWRWRRTRRGAAAFPMHTGTEMVPPDRSN
jgi:hypothetical protein